MESCLIHQTKVYLKEREIRKFSNNNIRKNAIHFNFEEEQTVKLLELLKVVSEVSKDYKDYHVLEKSFVNLVMNYVIENSLKVQTTVREVLFLRNSFEIKPMDISKDDYSLYVADTSIESLEYSYIGEIR